MYKKIKQLDNLNINLDDEEYKKYSRVLAVLESQSFTKGSHAIGKQFAKGLRIVDPTYVLYHCCPVYFAIISIGYDFTCSSTCKFASKI